MSGGSFPDRDFEARLMEVTLPGEESQEIPSHLQKSEPVQEAGAGVMDFASLAITAPSSEEAWWMMETKMVATRKMASEGRSLCLPLGILAVV